MRREAQTISPAMLRAALRLREQSPSEFKTLPPGVKLAALELEARDREQSALTSEFYDALKAERDKDPLAFSRKYSGTMCAALDAYVRSTKEKA